MRNDDHDRPRNQGNDDPEGSSDQRNPQSGRVNPSRHWQGGAPGETGNWPNRDARIDTRDYGRANQFGRAGTYGRAHERADARDDRRGQRINPKGYIRSDERLREDVCERLAYSGLDVSDVSVDVNDGRVTLHGTVPDRGTKHGIEDCADDCMGVGEIENRIAVERPGGLSRGQSSMDHQKP